MNYWISDFFYSTDKLPLYKVIQISSAIDLWKRIILIAEWEQCGEITLRIQSITTSESDCERFISKQRYVTGDHGTNYGISSMKARLQVMSNLSMIDI